MTERKKTAAGALAKLRAAAAPAVPASDALERNDATTQERKIRYTIELTRAERGHLASAALELGVDRSEVFRGLLRIHERDLVLQEALRDELEGRPARRQRGAR